MIGVNLSGAEFGNVGGRYGWEYIYPSASDLGYYADRGVELVRLPVKWERLQPTVGGAIDQAELGRLTKFLDDAQAAGVKVIVDIHNYGGYANVGMLGSDALPNSVFADFWKKLATAISDKPALTGYDLMNEPHDLAAGVWPAAAQAAVNAIRTVDMTHAIYVEGESWANAANWSVTNAGLNITDPAHKIVYEAHLYFDRWMSGTYQHSYDGEGAYDNVGVDRLADFARWLDERDAKGFIGEFAVPNNDPRWLTALDKFLDALEQHDIDGAYWGAGPWWGNYPLALRNAAGEANPQLAVLEQHIAAEAAAGDPVAPPAVGVDTGDIVLYDPGYDPGAATGGGVIASDGQTPVITTPAADPTPVVSVTPPPVQSRVVTNAPAPIVSGGAPTPIDTPVVTPAPEPAATPVVTVAQSPVVTPVVTVAPTPVATDARVPVVAPVVAPVVIAAVAEPVVNAAPAPVAEASYKMAAKISRVKLIDEGHVALAAVQAPAAAEKVVPMTSVSPVAAPAVEVAHVSAKADPVALVSPVEVAAKAAAVAPVVQAPAATAEATAVHAIADPVAATPLVAAAVTAPVVEKVVAPLPAFAPIAFTKAEAPISEAIKAAYVFDHAFDQHATVFDAGGAMDGHVMSNAAHFDLASIW